MARVPGCIKDDNTIGTNQVYPQTSSSGGDQEELDFGVCVKVVNQFFSVQGAGAAVQSVVIDPSNPGILTQDNVSLRTGSQPALPRPQSASCV